MVNGVPPLEQVARFDPNVKDAVDAAKDAQPLLPDDDDAASVALATGELASRTSGDTACTERRRGQPESFPTEWKCGWKRRTSSVDGRPDGCMSADVDSGEPGELNPDDEDDV